MNADREDRELACNFEHRDKAANLFENSEFFKVGFTFVININLDETI